MSRTTASIPMTAEDRELLLDEQARAVRFGPWVSVMDIAQRCREFSTAARECQARVEFVNGRPVAYLVRVPREQLPPDFLRHQG